MPVLLGSLAVLLIFLCAEALAHRRALRAIPIRIHVNGSRGKSSVTRLIAAALREAGIRTLAKTTGSRARIILPDGREEPVHRPGPPNISEQLKVLLRGRRESVEAVVVECMALRPDLQRASEDQIMHSTIGVITNVRPDHLEIMGPALEDVATSLGRAIPRHGVAVAGSNRQWETLSRIADQRGARLLLAERDGLPTGTMERFSYLEHEENVATALAVTRLLNISDDVALTGMVGSIPDVGACTNSKIQQKGRVIEFMNAFAANDLESTIEIWNKLGLEAGGSDPLFALLNLRGDRVHRSLQFAGALENEIRADYYVLVGDIPMRVKKTFQRRVPSPRLLALGQSEPSDIFDRIATLCESKARVAGIGNIGGLGHQILDYVRQEGSPPC
jgi:poly-gamma-glutamate synthase PgsB/CapB